MEPAEVPAEPAAVKDEAAAPDMDAGSSPETTPSRPLNQRPRRKARGSVAALAAVNIDDASTLADLWPSRKVKPDAAAAATPGKVRKARKKKETGLKSPRKRRSSSTPYSAVHLRSGTKLRSESCTATKTAAWLRAEEVQSSLDPNLPSFIKVLVRSHVGSCFFLGFPGPFCRTHLPYPDTSLIIEDEHGKQYDVKYIAQKTGLSAGWRQFSLDHGLLVDDILVIQLVEAAKLKVHIIRGLNRAEGAAELPHLDSPATNCPAENPGTEEPQPGLVTPKLGPGRRKRPNSLPLIILQKKKKKPRQQQQTSLTPEMGCSAQHSGNDSEEVGSEVLDIAKQSAPKLQFKDVASLENFKILIDGVLLDPEIPEDTRCKYYELCRSQNEFLHENLVEGINLKLVTGAISEIVRISDGIRACDPATTQEKFSTWVRILKAFEFLGMKVGFLRKRVERLTFLAFESGNATDARKLAEAKTKRTFVEDEMRKLELKLLELEEAKEKLCSEIESLHLKVESYELQFREEVNTPW